jgi:hypothetical protein
MESEMKPDELCERRAATGEAGAADVPEREAVAGTARGQAQDGLAQGFGRATFCRAGFARRGTASARSTERHTLASAFDPRRSLGSRL